MFAFPVWVQRAIDRIRRSFFWKGKSFINKFHYLAKWDHVCHPKRVGGIRICNFQATNSALLMKGLWKFFSSNSLPWVQLLKQKHYKRRPIATAASPPNGCCPIWRNMVRLIVLFLSSVDFILGDGKDTPFWNARWCGDITLRNRFPLLHKASANLNPTVNTWTLRFANLPNLGFNSLTNPLEHRELLLLSAVSSSIVLSSNTKDSLSWRWTSSERFSVKSAYAFLLFDRVNSTTLPFLWKLKIS